MSVYAETRNVSRGAVAARCGIVALLAAYAVFSWPGLYHLAADVLRIDESFTVAGVTVQRAWLFPASVDGGIFVAGSILLTHPDLVPSLRRHLWWGMWTIAGLSGLGLIADELARIPYGQARWAIPLVLVPVGIATWFLHMVVEAVHPVGDQVSPPRESRALEALDDEVDRKRLLHAVNYDEDMAELDADLEASMASHPAGNGQVTRMPASTAVMLAALAARPQVRASTKAPSQERGPCSPRCTHHLPPATVSKSTRYRCAATLAGKHNDCPECTKTREEQA